MSHRHAPDRSALALAIGVHGALVLLWLMTAIFCVAVT
ncbi:hypothetical protein BW41_00818 [Sphingomonas sp. RIT328]|nr:hypothetical protein BW41_00818 [Sphingomonas sp. RIT328]